MLTFLVGAMFAVGLTLTPKAVSASLRNVRLVMLALVLNFVMAPAFAWLLVRFVPLDPGHAAGLLLLGGAAGAPFLPKLVETAGGDLALAAAIMGLLNIGTILFLPFALPLMIDGFHAEPLTIARPLVLLIMLPLAVGMLVKSCAESLAMRLAPAFAKIGNAGLLLFCVLLVTLNLQALTSVIGSRAILVALIFFTGLLVVSWFLGGSKSKARGVLSLSTTARNFGAALVPASSSFSNPKVTVMVIVGAIVCLAVSFFAAGWLGRGTTPASA